MFAKFDFFIIANGLFVLGGSGGAVLGSVFRNRPGEHLLRQGERFSISRDVISASYTYKDL